MASKNFVILIGGPGQFIDCDPKHDKTWKNYVVPMQLAAMKDLYKKRPNETIHWFVFEPAYRNRWDDDSVITTYEQLEKFFFDHELHGLRKQAADKVSSGGSANYLHRMQQFATKWKIKYHGLQTPSDFWTELVKFADGSVSRVWYSGHAARAGLFLSLAHTAECTPVAGHLIATADIPKHLPQLERKFDSSSSGASEFYGCATSTFAETWHKTFKVPTQGAKKSITFSVIGKPGQNVLELLKTTPTPQGAPEWTAFPRKP